jgi:hypothetical protein
VFGYIRPYKPELKMREFTRYRACYCGLCKMIKQDYGEIPRYSTTYDLTFLTLTLLALDPVDYGQNLERCFFHAGQKTPVATPSDPLSYVAGLAVLLSYYKILDNIDDRDKPVQSRLAQTAYKSSYKKAKAAFPEEEAIIKNAMAIQADMEKEYKDYKEDRLWDLASEPFGKLLSDLLARVPDRLPNLGLKPGDAKALSYLGLYMGRWIYLMDAFDDLEEDIKNASFNPLAFVEDPDKLREALGQKLISYEEEMNLALELLPFQRDQSILRNITQMGLPYVRDTLFAGQKLPRV